MKKRPTLSLCNLKESAVTNYQFCCVPFRLSQWDYLNPRSRGWRMKIRTENPGCSTNLMSPYPPKTWLSTRRMEAVQANVDWWWWSGAFWRRRQLLEVLNGWLSLNNWTDSQEVLSSAMLSRGWRGEILQFPLQVSWVSMAKSHNDLLLPVDKLLYRRTKWLGAVEPLSQWMKFL